MNVDELKSAIIDMIIEMGENEVKALELHPSDLSDVIYTICVDIRHGVYLELKEKGIIKD